MAIPDLCSGFLVSEIQVVSSFSLRSGLVRECVLGIDRSRPYLGFHTSGRIGGPRYQEGTVNEAFGLTAKWQRSRYGYEQRDS